MAGHTQQPSGRRNPGPAPSPSPGPGPGPGASERVALKKEIGLVSACTIIIGERGRGARVSGVAGTKAWGALLPETRGTPLRALLPSVTVGHVRDAQSTCGCLPSQSGSRASCSHLPKQPEVLHLTGAGPIHRWDPPAAFTLVRVSARQIALSFLIYEREVTIILPWVQEPC